MHGKMSLELSDASSRWPEPGSTGRAAWTEGLVGNSGRAGGEQSAGGTWCELGRVAKYREQEETDGWRAWASCRTRVTSASGNGPRFLAWRLCQLVYPSVSPRAVGFVRGWWETSGGRAERCSVAFCFEARGDLYAWWRNLVQLPSVRIFATITLNFIPCAATIFQPCVQWGRCEVHIYSVHIIV